MDLMYTTLMFCQFFFCRETRKLTAMTIWVLISSGVMLTLATEALRQNTFFSCHLMVRFTVSTLVTRLSEGEIMTGNLLARWTEKEEEVATRTHKT